MPLSSINPKLTKTWPRLQAHFNELKEDHFYDYFKKDNERANKFSISWNKFYFDFSKNKINVKLPHWSNSAFTYPVPVNMDTTLNNTDLKLKLFDPLINK